MWLCLVAVAIAYTHMMNFNGLCMPHKTSFAKAAIKKRYKLTKENASTKMQSACAQSCADHDDMHHLALIRALVVALAASTAVIFATTQIFAFQFKTTNNST